MSLSLNSPNCQPAFGSNNLVAKARRIVQNQAEHVLVQSASWSTLELKNPSPDLKFALGRKLTIDLIEALYLKIGKDQTVAICRNCTNVLSYLFDSVKLLSKTFSK